MGLKPTRDCDAEAAAIALERFGRPDHFVIGLVAPLHSVTWRRGVPRGVLPHVQLRSIGQ